jgi:hypothetical protein
MSYSEPKTSHFCALILSSRALCRSTSRSSTPIGILDLRPVACISGQLQLKKAGSQNLPRFGLWPHHPLLISEEGRSNATGRGTIALLVTALTLPSINLGVYSPSLTTKTSTRRLMKTHPTQQFTQKSYSTQSPSTSLVSIIRIQITNI